MELKQNPFSLYDFLGYFTPGAIFIYSCMSILAHSHGIPVVEAISFEQSQLYIPFVLASYTSGHLLSFISSVFVEKYSIWVCGYPSKYLLGYKADSYFKTNSLIRFGVGAFLAPISLLEYFFNLTLKYRATYTRPLDKLLITIVRAKAHDLLREKNGLLKFPSNSHAANTDFFRFIYHYAVENTPNHYPKMQNYVAIYGFLRTMTLISVLLFWGLTWYVYSHDHSGLEIAFILVGAALLTFTFYMSFLKFWRRFCLETLMALAANYDVKKKIDPATITADLETVETKSKDASR